MIQSAALATIAPFTSRKKSNAGTSPSEGPRVTYLAGTRDLSSSIQLTTTVMVGSGAGVAASAVSLSIRNRWPSAETSYERRS